jgi:hypothetical protein
MNRTDMMPEKRYMDYYMAIIYRCLLKDKDLFSDNNIRRGMTDEMANYLIELFESKHYKNSFWKKLANRIKDIHVIV